MEEEIRLDKMAKVRAAKKPPAYKNIHEDIKALPDDNTLSVKNVKEWEKHNKDRARYFDTSVWLDLFYGKDQEHKTTYRTLVYAYDSEGFIKTNASTGD